MAEHASSKRKQERWSPLAGLVSGMNILGTLLIIALMILINADVLGRNLFGAPISGVIELAESAIVCIVFLQIGHSLRVGQLARSDGFLNLMLSKRPRIARTLSMFYNLTGAIMFIYVCVAVLSRFVDAWQGNFYKGVPGEFTVPTWPVEFVILAGSAVMVLQFLALALTDIKSLLHDRSGN